MIAWLSNMDIIFLHFQKKNSANLRSTITTHILKEEERNTKNKRVIASYRRIINFYLTLTFKRKKILFFNSFYFNSYKTTRRYEIFAKWKKFIIKERLNWFVMLDKKVKRDEIMNYSLFWIRICERIFNHKRIEFLLNFFSSYFIVFEKWCKKIVIKDMKMFPPPQCDISHNRLHHNKLISIRIQINIEKF